MHGRPYINFVFQNYKIIIFLEGSLLLTSHSREKKMLLLERFHYLYLFFICRSYELENTKQNLRCAGNGTLFYYTSR